MADRVFLVVCISITALLLGFVWDCRSWTRFLRRYHELNHEGKWDELERLILREFSRFRPFAGPYLRFKSPGVLDALYASYLYERGRSQEALVSAEASVRKAGNNVQVLAGALNVQALALIELQQYEPARPIAERLRAIGAVYAGNYVDSVRGFFEGRLDEALEASLRSCKDPKGVLSRGTASILFLFKGDHKAALEVLLDKPPDVTTYYRAEMLEKIERTSLGRSLLEAHQKQYAGLIEPLRYLRAAYVCFDMGDVEGLRFAMERAGEVMGGHPTVQILHRQMNATLSALTGDATGADRWLREGSELLKNHPRRGSQMEFHRYSGRVHLQLGRAPAAAAEFEEAQKLNRHPIDKHVGHYWLARAAEAQGEKGKALEYYRAVVADGIASRYRDEASKALAH